MFSPLKDVKKIIIIIIIISQIVREYDTIPTCVTVVCVRGVKRVRKWGQQTDGENSKKDGMNQTKSHKRRHGTRVREMTDETDREKTNKEKQ